MIVLYFVVFRFLPQAHLAWHSRNLCFLYLRESAVLLPSHLLLPGRPLENNDLDSIRSKCILRRYAIRLGQVATRESRVKATSAASLRRTTSMAGTKGASGRPLGAKTLEDWLPVVSRFTFSLALPTAASAHVVSTLRPPLCG